MPEALTLTSALLAEASRAPASLFFSFFLLDLLDLLGLLVTGVMSLFLFTSGKGSKESRVLARVPVEDAIGMEDDVIGIEEEATVMAEV